MKRLSSLLAVLLLFPPSLVAGWRDKVDPWLLERLDPGRPVDFLVWMAERADLEGAGRLRTKEARGRFVFEALRGAQRSQGPLLAELEGRGLPHRSFWIVNMIRVQGGVADLRRIAARGDVASIHANPRVAPRLPRGREREALAAIEPNLSQILVPQVFWAAGFTGEGIVVAHADTGVDWDHPALREQYRGWDGANAVHERNWHDAIHSGGGICGADSPVPCDDADHGTPTMGVLVGDDGGANQVGVAPGARWMSCRNMDEGVGTPATYTECFEFFLAPTDAAGGDPDPLLAPHVVSNSWRCPPEEGCTDPKILQDVVGSLRAAGIVVVAAAGNDGSACSSVNAPPGIYTEAWTVGAVNLEGEAEAFSSRGPVAVDGSGRLKPDFMAPGRDIRSSARGGGYLSYSGTSLAAPHVAGLAALMMSAGGCLTGDGNALERRIKESALPFTTSETCGDTDGISPNNTYGWGIVQATLPQPGDCQPSPGGIAEGLILDGYRCRNRSTGGAVSAAAGGATSWDCGEAGLPFAAGDSILQILRGRAIAAEVSGHLSGLIEAAGGCRNRATGRTVPMAVEADGGWSCSGAGLDVATGDPIDVLLSGNVD